MKFGPGSWLLALAGARRRVAARSVAVLAVCLAAAGGPASQLLWIEEVSSADKHAAPQYRIVLATGYDTACGQTPRANSQEPRAKSQEPPPRILKPLADHWEAGARTHLDSADVPLPPQLPVLLDADLPQTQAARPCVCLEFYPPGPPVRGPPATF